MASEFLSTVILLSFVVDPFGNVPAVNTMLAGVAPARRRTVVLRECAIAFAILMAFMAFGRQILLVMRLSQTSLSIAGGVILLLIAIRMVFAYPEGAFGPHVARGEPLIVPLAVPLIAGPSALATVMLLASRAGNDLVLIAAALTVTMALTTVILLAGDRLQRLLGESMMQAVGRLMGLILTAIAIEMLLGGVRGFVESLR